MYAFVSRPVLRNGVERFVGSSKGYEERSCHLASVSAPVGASGRKGLGNGGGSGRFGLDGTSTKHDTAGEDSRLSAIVVGHLGPRVVNKDLGSTGTFPAGHLWLGRVGRGEGVDALRVGENGVGGRGARRRPGVGGDGRAIGRPVDGGKGVGGEGGLDGREVCVDGGDPCWLSDVVGEDSKQFILFSRVIFE